MTYISKFIAPLVVSSIIVLSGIANAKDGAYVSAFGGATFDSSLSMSYSPIISSLDVDIEGALGKVDFKTATPFGFSVGYNIQNLSFDISYTNINSKFSIDRSTKSISHFAFANVYYNFNNLSTFVQPYVGFGMGIAKSKLEFDDGSSIKFKNAFAYQGAIGLKFNIHKNFLIFTDVRHIASANSELEESLGLVKGKVKYYSANIGVSYLF